MTWRIVLGAALCLIGGIWFLQGIGVAKGSTMTGESQWTVIGLLCVIGGVALVVTALRERGRGKP